jgi:cobalt-zinc-cadmium resistance protein CzcA
LPLLYLLFSSPRKRNKKSQITSISVFIIVLFFFQNANAQSTSRQLSVEEIINIALNNNLELQSQQLNVQSASMLKKSVFELPKTNVNVQFGQNNSINQDNSFQISQSIPFPSYYKAKSGLYSAELLASQLKLQMSQNELKAQVKYWIFQLMYLQNARKQLQSMDSLYVDFVSTADLRYQSGETNLLEKTTANTKRGLLALIINQNETEAATAYASLKQLMNSGDEFTIRDSISFQPLSINNSLDINQVTLNPSLMALYQEAMIAKQAIKLESAAILPDLNVGYFNQSLTGIQTINGKEEYFDRSKRFNGFNVGISIPFTYFSNTAKIKSLNYKQQALTIEADHGKLLLQTQLQNAFQQYNQNMAQYNYYKSNALPNAELMISIAKTTYRSGEIGYIEYLQAMQTASEVKLNYLQSINQLNQSIININFLINR